MRVGKLRLAIIEDFRNMILGEACAYLPNVINAAQVFLVCRKGSEFPKHGPGKILSPIETVFTLIKAQ